MLGSVGPARIPLVRQLVCSGGENWSYSGALDILSARPYSSCFELLVCVFLVHGWASRCLNINDALVGVNQSKPTAESTELTSASIRIGFASEFCAAISGSFRPCPVTVTTTVQSSGIPDS